VAARDWQLQRDGHKTETDKNVEQKIGTINNVVCEGKQLVIVS
jgi:hypothetical protein